MFILLKACLLILLLQLAASTKKWQNIFNVSSTIPGNLLQLQFQNGDQVTGNIISAQSYFTDLDAYVFQDGSNLLNNQEAILKFISLNQQKQDITALINQTGIHYFKIYAYNTQSFTPCVVNLTISNIYSGLNRTIGTTMQIMPLDQYGFPRNFFKTPSQTISLKYHIQSDIQLQVFLFDSSSGNQHKVLPDTELSTPFSGTQQNWYLLWKTNSETQITRPVAFTCQILTKINLLCPNGTTWNIITQICQPNGPNNILSIVLGAIGGLFLIIGIALTIYCCRKKKPQQQIIKYVDQNDLYPKKRPQLAIVQIQIDKNEPCSICLESQCNWMLTSCFHKFHKGCIDDWMKKNNLCPVCRIELFPPDLVSASSSQGLNIV